MDYIPPFGSTDPNAPYINGLPGVKKGSPVPAEAIEYTQREVVNVIKAAGLTPSNEDLAQLSQAIPIVMGDVLPHNRVVITTSGTFTAPKTGYYRVTCIGGGGAGGSQSNYSGGQGCGGSGGGNTSFGTYLTADGGGGGGGGRLYGGSGGGAAGFIAAGYIFIDAAQAVSVAIGAGGSISTVNGTLPTGKGCGYNATSAQTNYAGGSGAQGAGNGGTGALAEGNGYAGNGGSGGSNGTGYGGGGGGAAGGLYTIGSNPGRSADNAPGAPNALAGGSGNLGANGGPGAVIIEY